MSADYVCANCGGSFESDRSDEDARAEYAQNFGEVATDDMIVVCDDCYKAMTEAWPISDATAMMVDAINSGLATIYQCANGHKSLFLQFEEVSPCATILNEDGSLSWTGAGTVCGAEVIAMKGSDGQEVSS